MEQVVDFIALALRNSLSLAYGLGVTFAILYVIMQLQLVMWRRVAVGYAGSFERQGEPSKLVGAVTIAETGIRWAVRSNRKQNVYPPVHVTILPEGIGLQIMQPFRWGAKPLVLPYDEMELASVKWGLWGNPIAIRMRRAEGIDIILYRDAMDWAARHSPRFAALLAQAVPRANEPVVY